MRQDWLLQWLGSDAYTRDFYLSFSKQSQLSKLLHRKEMLVWSSNEHVLINFKIIPFDSMLHVRDYLFLSYKSCLFSPFPVSVPGLEPQDKLSWHPSGHSFQWNLIPTISYLIQGNQCVVETYKSSHYSTHLFFPEHPIRSSYSTVKPFYVSHQLKSAPEGAVCSIAFFPM